MNTEQNVFRDPPNRKAVTTFEVWKSPEFKAFCEKFGIAWGLRTSGDLIIRLPSDGIMTIEQEYQGSKEVG